MGHRWQRRSSILLGLLLLGGCTKASDNTTAVTEKISGSFTAQMTLHMEELEATGTLSRLGAGVWQASFTAPSTLSGVVLDFSEGTVRASYKGLDFSVPQSAIPAKSVLSNLIQVVDELASQETCTGTVQEAGVCISGTLESSPYTVTLREDGSLAQFAMEGLGAVVEFSGVTVIKPDTTLSSEASQ